MAKSIYSNRGMKVVKSPSGILPSFLPPFLYFPFPFFLPPFLPQLPSLLQILMIELGAKNGPEKNPSLRELTSVHKPRIPKKW